MNYERNSPSPDTFFPIMASMQLDKQLKLLLKQKDVTVAQLARKVGVSSKTIYNWLSGQHPKDIEAVKKVADHFKVSLDFICYGESPAARNTQIEKFEDEINAGVFEVVLRRVKK